MPKLCKLIVACAMSLCASVAKAGITPGAMGNPSLNLIAFNMATQAWYIRDTGFLMNDFLPNSVTTRPGDGGVTGDKTPDAGLLLDKNNTANFSDPSFSTWLATQSVGDVRWMLSAADSRFTNVNNVQRVITSSAYMGMSVANYQINGYVGLASRLNELTGDFGLSASGQDPWPFALETNFGFSTLTLAELDQSVGLFYFSRSTPFGSSSMPADSFQYANQAGYATVTLESDGDFVYQLAGVPSPVPIPAAAWLLGSGLLAVAGLTRRRRAGT